MARNFGSPLLQRPGAIDPNDPRRKRLPLTPEEDPYGGIVPDLEVDLPELASPLPQAPLTQPPAIGTQTGAKLPMEQWQTPPQDLTALRAWYSGAAKVPGAPAAPEWGKQTPTYSRLHPPPPKPVEPLPAPRVPVVQPTALGGFGNVGPASVGQALQGQMQGQMQQAAIQARQPVATRPTLSQPAQPQVAIADRQRFTLAEAERRALQQKLAAQGAGQYLQEAGMGDLNFERPTPPKRSVASLAQELLVRQAGGAVGRTIGAPNRTVPETLKDQYLAIKAGIPQAGATALGFMDVLGRSATAGAPVGQPGTTYSPSPATVTPSPVFGYTAQGLRGASENILGQRSAGIQALEQRAEMEQAAAQDNAIEQVARFALQVYKDPALAEKHILTNLPMMLPGLAAGKVTQAAALVSRLATAEQAAGLGAGTAAALGGAMTAADAQSTAYDNIKQALMARGIPEKDADQQAFRQSLLSFGIGAAIGGFTGSSGLETTAFKGGASGIRARLSRAAAEMGGEQFEELTPLITSNIQAGLPAMRNVGQTAAATALATAPSAAMAALGAPKVPDALQSETASTVAPPTGQFKGVVPPSAKRQAYETWTQAGGPRAPEAYQVLRKSRSLPGQQGLPPVGLPSVGLPAGTVPAPQRPGVPPSVTPPKPAPTVEPTTEAVEPTVEQPEELYKLKGEWPVSQTYLTPVQLQMRQKQGPDVSDAVGMGLEDLQAEYKQKGYFTRAGKRIKNAPTPRDVQGEEGNIPQMMYKAPNLREFIDKGGAAAYGVNPTDNPFDAYERIVGGVASEMTELTGEPYSIDRVQKMGNKEWGQWFDTYGKARGLDFTRDLRSILEPTTGKQMGAVMPGEEFENLFGFGGKKAGQAERGQVQEALQEDIAKLFGMPFNKVSLTQVTPTMWRQWAAVRRISPEGLKGIQRSIKAAEEYKGRTLLTKKESALRDERKTQPVSEWYEKMYGRPSSLGKRQGPPPAAPTTPVTPSPTPPPAPPTAPSAERGRYLSQVQQGLPRAPLAFQPRSYTQGVASIEEARRAREEARQARERLKKQSPFAKAREAERDIIEGRRPEPPAATEPVTPKPTPPAPPAPAGKAVTPEAMQEAGIDESYLESLAKKYGTPPAPVRESAGILGPLGRAANMLERAAGKAKSTDELAEILKHAQRIKAHRAVIEIARNPNTDDKTFEKAVKDKETNKYVNSSYWDSLRAKRAERTKAATPTPKPAETPAGPLGMLSDFGKAAGQTLTDIRERISNVRHGGFKDDQYDIVLFKLDGQEYEGVLKGRNQDLILGSGEEADRAIALRVLLDKDAAPVPETTKAKEGKVKTAPQEVKQVFATLDTPSGKKTRTRNIIKAEYPDIGAKAIFVNDNIEQIIAEAEANGKVTKECP